MHLRVYMFGQAHVFACVQHVFCACKPMCVHCMYMHVCTRVLSTCMCVYMYKHTPCVCAHMHACNPTRCLGKREGQLWWHPGQV